jgi:hypothetical protein
MEKVLKVEDSQKIFKYSKERRIESSETTLITKVQALSIDEPFFTAMEFNILLSL